METMTYAVPNILVVDDINANLVILTEIIRNVGYIARPANSARQAMSAIEALAPQLILLDVSMPEMDGFEFCTMLKKNVATRDIPIIFISGLCSAEDKIRGFKIGAVDYISKPFETEEVTLRINTHLKIYRMQQELALYNKKLYQVINDQAKKIYYEQKNLLYALTRLIIGKNHSKAEHLEHVGRNSRLLAMSMQLSYDNTENISTSFIDVIGIASGLHEIEINTLKEIYSNNEDNSFLKMAVDIAEHHHRYWDGTGFLEGLSGKDIPLSSRIVAIADAYDDLMAESTADSEIAHEESIKAINDASGKRFDPDIVKIMNKIQNQLGR
ncbi:MAG TPA: response regulator [Mobilitalea sp.]|nr:response regulator [Mobilitalea sp.]